MRNASAEMSKGPEISAVTVALQVGRSNALSLFCVPGAGATGASFHELVSCLPKTWRIHSFEPEPQGDGSLLPYSTVSAAADGYLAALGEIHSKGPVHLLGHSFGGWVAFEMAKQLTKAGRVASLTILDSQPPPHHLGACPFVRIMNDSSYDCFPLWLASAVIHECLRVLWPDGAAAATQSQGGKP
jgi:pimeloyl-ACP methyl ester carboxylesterase